jgi:A nuclease family of the HNH/ENDO VII superfamily with conserved AHH
MKKFILHSLITSFLVTNSSIITSLPSAAAPVYPPACGTALDLDQKKMARDKLVTNLGPGVGTASGQYQSETTPQAHHILPLEYFSNAVGKKICGFGINLLDGKENGVWLPARNCTNKPKFAYIHRGSHTKEYLTYVSGKLDQATKQSEALTILSNLKKQFSITPNTSGVYPDLPQLNAAEANTIPDVLCK